MSEFLCKYNITDIDEIKAVVEDLLRGVKTSRALSEEKDFQIKLVINELLVNCFKHAHADEEHPVHIDAKVEDDQLSFTVEDMGEGFEHESYNTGEMEDDDESLFSEKGRGLFLASQMTSTLEFNPKGNRVLAKIDL